MLAKKAAAFLCGSFFLMETPASPLSGLHQKDSTPYSIESTFSQT